MREGPVLIGGYHARRAVSSVFGIALMAACAAAVVFMGMLWPAFRYHHMASAESARWGVHVNGPLTDADVELIAETARSSHADSRIEVVNRGSLSELSSDSAAVAGGDLYAHDPAGAVDFALAWAPAPLVVAGDMDYPAAVGIDWVTARALAVAPGDTVTFTQVYSARSGARNEQSGTARVSAILATTKELRGLVMQSPAALRAAVQSTVGVVATDAFVETDQPARIARALGALPAAQNWTVETAAAHRAAATAAALSAGAQTYGQAGLLVTTGVLLAIMLRDLFTRMGRRRSPLAILYSMGARPSHLIAAHLAEQTFIIVVVLATGYRFGLHVLVEQVGLYPPLAARAALLGSWTLFAVVLALACAALVAARSREHSLVAVAADWRS